jgi:predicted alpha/beta superfamily hydrolase
MIMVALGLTMAATNSFASIDQEPNSWTPITYGNYRQIYSKVMNENRTLLVHLPADYNTSGRIYPAIYVLDGDRDVFLRTCAALNYLVTFNKVPDHIVVGIENTNRMRDMSPEQGADNFIQFIKGELIPFIDNNYRTSRFKILCGQSASSVFTLYSFLKQPDLFDGYILSSFGLRHSPGVSSLFELELKKSNFKSPGRRYLFISNGKLDGYDPDGSRTKGGTEFLDSLRQTVPATVLLKYKVYDDEGHVPYPTVYDGLKWIYSEKSHK